MDKETWINTLNRSYSPLSIECQKELEEAVIIRVLKKGSILVHEGQYSDKSFFIVEGCARAYYLKDGKDISDWFAFENEFISSIISFFTKEASPHYIELLEDCILLELSRESIDYLADKYHDFERLIRMVITKTMLSQQQRIVSIQFQKAEERYANILATFPAITQRIPLTHIASYLGVTLETLSRIRNPRKRI